MINIVEPKENVIDRMAKIYNKTSQTGSINRESHSLEALKRAYERDPDSLNGLQLLALGYASLDKESNEKKRDKEEMISVNESQLKQLQSELAEMNEKLNQYYKNMNGGEQGD